MQHQNLRHGSTRIYTDQKFKDKGEKKATDGHR